MIDGIPRRCFLEHMTPAESAIREAMLKVEGMPAHPLLTEAVCLLGRAKDRVSDFVDLPAGGDRDTPSK